MAKLIIFPPSPPHHHPPPSLPLLRGLEALQALTPLLHTVKPRVDLRSKLLNRRACSLSHRPCGTNIVFFGQMNI